jgi:AcrR family transcriptional regulator
LKRGYHHGNLRQALVEAALALIAEQGPQGFTLSEAAKAADVTPAAVYRHFAGRDDLLAEVARQGFDIFAALLEYAWNDGKPPPWPPSRRRAAPIWPLPANIPAIIRRCSKAGCNRARHPDLAQVSEGAG